MHDSNFCYQYCTVSPREASAPPPPQICLWLHRILDSYLLTQLTSWLSLQRLSQKINGKVNLQLHNFPSYISFFTSMTAHCNDNINSQANLVSFYRQRVSKFPVDTIFQFLKKYLYWFIFSSEPMLLPN